MQRLCVGILVAAVCFAGVHAFAENASDADKFSTLKKDVEELRARLAKKKQRTASGTIQRTDALIDNKYGPNAKVTTKDGRLKMGGLVQIWWYSIQNDQRDFVALVPSSNEVFDNDSYRIRRAELKFTMDISKEVTAVIMIDPTGQDEGNSFAGLPSNQGLVAKGNPLSQFNGRLNDPIITSGPTGINNFTNLGFSRGSFMTGSFSSGIDDPNNSGFTDIQRARVQQGVVIANRVLQDAYINYHSHWIPNHDFTVGQFKPPMGEEGNRNSGQLDFVERAMINQFSNQRDLGVMVHGSWWSGRFQYWIGAFNAPGTFHNTFASYQNRSDDNDPFDLAWKVLVRPVWHDETWGSLELGYSRQDGVHFESGPGTDGLGFKESHAFRHYAWMWYRPGSIMKGFWMRGEFSELKDRYQALVQADPQVFRRDGWYGAVGYNLSKSIWADDLKNGGWIKRMLHDVEFAFRYERFGNLLLADIPNNNETDVFKTDIVTAGLNYYWKGYNVRTQLNYLWVNELESDIRIREVRNDIFVINHQVQW